MTLALITCFISYTMSYIVVLTPFLCGYKSHFNLGRSSIFGVLLVV